VSVEVAAPGQERDMFLFAPKAIIESELRSLAVVAVLDRHDLR